MGEVVNMRQYPQLNLELTIEAENSDALQSYRELESLIAGDPKAVIAAIDVYLAEFNPDNHGKSLRQILTDNKSKVNDARVIPAYGVWKTIEREEHFKYLGEFSEDIEDSIAEDDNIRQLIRTLRNTHNRGSQDETRRQIRAARMQFYIGSLASKTEVEAEKTTDSPENPEIAANTDAA